MHSSAMPLYLPAPAPAQCAARVHTHTHTHTPSLFAQAAQSHLTEYLVLVFFLFLLFYFLFSGKQLVSMAGYADPVNHIAIQPIEEPIDEHGKAVRKLEGHPRALNSARIPCHARHACNTRLHAATRCWPSRVQCARKDCRHAALRCTCRCLYLASLRCTCSCRGLARVYE